MIGSLAVSLSLETAAFNNAATAAEKRASTMGGKFAAMGKNLAGIGLALGGAVVLGGITSAVTGAFEMASALSEASQKLGLTVEGLQRLRFAAKESGVSNEQLDSALTKLNKSMGELQLGSKSATDAFARIGIFADELKGKSPDEALKIIADELNKLPTLQERVAVGSQLMGRGFAQLIPMIAGGSAELNKHAEASKKNGEISTADAKKLDELADAWDRFKTKIGVVSANLIASTSSFFDFYNNGLIKLGQWTKDTDAKIADMARNAVAWVGKMVTGIGELITGKLSAIWEGAKNKIESVKNAFKDLGDKVQFNSYMPDMIAGIAEEFAKLASIMVDPSLSATQKVGAAFQSLGRIVGGVIGGKAGGILGAIGGFASALAPLFGAKTPGPAYNGVGGNLIPGLATGGHGTFGGIAGVDKNLLSVNGSPVARVSKGEHFSVMSNGGGMQVRVVKGDLFDVIVDRRASNVAAPMAGQAAVMGAQGGAQAITRRGSRMLPR